MSKLDSRYCKRIQLLITKNDEKLIKKLKRELNCSNSELFRQAVRDYSERYQAGNVVLLQKISPGMRAT